MKRALTFCLIAASLTGCSRFPELDHTQSAALETADYPAFVPIEPLLARANAPGPDPQQTEDDLNSRLSTLRARANRMRGAVLSDAEKRRLKTGLR